MQVGVRVTTILVAAHQISLMMEERKLSSPRRILQSRSTAIGVVF
jgi:hypothetical protein